MYTPGQEVEVKVGGSLGRWVAGKVIKATTGCCGQRQCFEVLAGTQTLEVGSRELRRPRRKQVANVAAAPQRGNRKARAVGTGNGRGPLRFPKYKSWVKTKPCIFCFEKADDPHHYGPKGTGQTTDDTRLTAVCRQCHDALHHRRPDELRNPTAYLRDDPEHAWAIVEARVFSKQGEHLAEYIRIHGELS